MICYYDLLIVRLCIVKNEKFGVFLQVTIPFFFERLRTHLIFGLIYVTMWVEILGFLKMFHFDRIWFRGFSFEARLGVWMAGAKKLVDKNGKNSESNNKLLSAAMVAVMVALLAINTRTSWSSFLGLNHQNLNRCKQVCNLSLSHLGFCGLLHFLIIDVGWVVFCMFFKWC